MPPFWQGDEAHNVCLLKEFTHVCINVTLHMKIFAILPNTVKSWWSLGTAYHFSSKHHRVLFGAWDFAQRDTSGSTGGTFLRMKWVYSVRLSACFDSKQRCDVQHKLYSTSSWSSTEVSFTGKVTVKGEVRIDNNSYCGSATVDLVWAGRCTTRTSIMCLHKPPLPLHRYCQIAPPCNDQ